MNIFKGKLFLLVVGLDTSNILSFRSFQNGHEVIQLLLELGADGCLSLIGDSREESGDEGGRGRGNESI